MEKKKAIDSKPKGDRDVFTLFQKDPNCDVCPMTKTSRARCKNTPLKRADGISQAASYGDSITADDTLLNLDDEPKHVYWFILGTWFLPAKKRNARNSIVLAEVPASIPKARKSLHRQFKGVTMRAGTYNGLTMRILFVQKPTGSLFDEKAKQQ